MTTAHQNIINKEKLPSNEGDLSVTIPTRSLREIEKLVSLRSSENSIKLFYDKGQLVFISSKDEDSLIQLPRNFNKAMGIAEDCENQKLAVACKDEVILFKNSSELANYYPKAPNKYDALYMPRITYHTGAVDIHDLSFGSNGDIYAVNTLFSSIIKLDENYSFTPVWTPPQIDKITSEDRCHLNGMAMLNGKPKYATAFNEGDWDPNSSSYESTKCETTKRPFAYL